jgi:hypothetical protein
MMENTDMDGETTQSESSLTTQGSNQSDHGWEKAIGRPLERVTGTKVKMSREDMKKFRFVGGRDPMPPEERGVQVALRLTVETYQRVQRLAKKLKCTESKAIERLIRTEESERIEKTQPIDKSSLIDMRKRYSITNILNKY